MLNVTKMPASIASHPSLSKPRLLCCAAARYPIFGYRPGGLGMRVQSSVKAGNAMTKLPSDVRYAHSCTSALWDLNRGPGGLQ
jgi:hypothetical protein